MGDLKEDFASYKELKKLENERKLEMRRSHALEQLSKKGFEVAIENPAKLSFQFKGEKVVFWPLTGWASGKSITDGRGLKNLLKQLH